MRDTGTLHLMAISGLHIALAASIVWLLARGLQFLMPGHWIHWQIPLLAGLLFAAFYAWLTGLQPPALRTVIALAVLAALRIGARQWSPWQVWVLLYRGNPDKRSLSRAFSKSGPFSFCRRRADFLVSVAASSRGHRVRWLQPLVNLLYLQTGMLLLLMPLQVLIFHGFSLSSLVANLFAVPLVTFVCVPLILSGMLLHLLPLTALKVPSGLQPINPWGGCSGC
ncbi:ComEC/Rec2 family competence protein [Enterobacter ludwigii]|uniref:ComEC/Rec2 family competence protein n=1 Tax=Enterobacter ludwigii TaxID=299767 RepID=UPI003D1E675F